MASNILESSQMAEALAAALRERGQRVTPQRLAVAAVIEKYGGHVTAETVHKMLLERVPGVSLPTVYATLERLEALGLIRRLLTESGAVVYDPDLSEHHHLSCGRCGAVTDIEAQVDESELLGAAVAAGFEPMRTQVVVTGFCESCRADDS